MYVCLCTYLHVHIPIVYVHTPYTYVLQLYYGNVIMLPQHNYITCKSHSQHIKCIYRPNIFADLCLNTANSNTCFSCYCQICSTNKYAHQIRHIYHIFPISDRCIWKMYTHICAIYEVTAVNHMTMETVHIFDIYH